MENVDLNNTYWEKQYDFVTELRVDVRWLLRENDGDRPLGSLRIAAFPDIQHPGHLRAIFTYVTSIRFKSDVEILQTVEDYKMNEQELEVYLVDRDTKTNTDTYEAPFKELNELFGVNIFE